MSRRVYELWMMNLDKFLACNEHEMVGYESGMVMIWDKIPYSWMEDDELVWFDLEYKKGWL